MIINKVKLKNFRRYKNEKIEFNKGQTQISGENGSGKSSLLQAVYFGLYQTEGIRQFEENINLDNIVRKGADNCLISVTFSIDENEYNTTWKISIKSTDGDRSARTKECTLTGDTLESTISGVKSVTSKVTSILGMDAESFINSVFIQQGDITRLIYASDSQKKEIFDSLLGLRRVDRYIERTKEARREAKSIRDTYKDKRMEVSSQISSEDNESKLRERYTEIQSKIDDIEQQINRAKETQSQLKDKRAELKAEINASEEIATEIQKKTDTIEKLESQIYDVEETIEQKESLLNNLKDKKKNIETKIGSTHSRISYIDPDNSTVEELNLRLETLSSDREKFSADINKNEKKQVRLESEINQVNGNVESVVSDIRNLKENKDETLSDSNACMSRIQDTVKKHSRIYDEVKGELELKIEICQEHGVDISTHINSLDRSQVLQIESETKEILSDIRSEINNLNSEIIEYSTVISQVEELRDTGVCPVCGVSHENDEAAEREDRHKEVLYQKKEIKKTLKQKKTVVKDLLDGIQNAKIKIENIESLRNQIQRDIQDAGDLVTDFRSYRENIDEKRDSLSEFNQKKQNKDQKLSEIKEKVKQLKHRKSVIEHRENLVRSLIEDKQELNRISEKIEQAEESYAQQSDKKESLRERVDKLKSEVKELREKSDVSDLKSQVHTIDNNIEKINTKVEEKTDELSELREKSGSLDEKIQNIENLKKKKREMQEMLDSANEKISELNGLRESYEEVKHTIRRENIELLNRYVNDVFDDLYGAETYHSVEISDEYEITLLDSDGESLQPEMTSGGESALLNLALRAGIYRLIAERRGTATTLPPLILDEPTTYLDESHVERLHSLLSSVNEWDTQQVFVVSHNKALQATGDTTVLVKKDSTSNTSSVEML